MFSNMIRKWKLRRKLKAYVATLSPEKQQQANELRRKLDKATPEQSVIIMRNEIAAISQKQVKVVERLAEVSNNLK